MEDTESDWNYVSVTSYLLDYPESAYALIKLYLVSHGNDSVGLRPCKIWNQYLCDFVSTSVGSGIYTPEAVQGYHYDMETESGPLMLRIEVPAP